MENLKNVNGQFSLNFNLREPKKMQGQTQVYAVVKVNGKQLKFAIGCKLNAWNWDNKKQVPRFTNSMSTQEIENVLQINNVINDVRNEFFVYLCTCESITESGIKEIITSYNTNKMANHNPKRPTTSKTKSATKALDEAFKQMYGTKENPKKGYEKNAQFLRYFKDYLKESNQTDSIRNLEDAIYNYHDSFENVTNNYISQVCNTIIRLYNSNYIQRNKNYQTIDFKPQKIDFYKRETSVNKNLEEQMRRALTDKEVNAVMELENLTERQIVFRDIFKMQLETGVRVSDVEKLFTHQYETTFERGKEIQTIYTEKNDILAVIHVNPTIKALQQKYKDGLIDANGEKVNIVNCTYNRNLQKMFELAKLTNIETYYKDNKGAKEKHENRLCDIISSHWARHTFVTKKLLDGWRVDFLCNCTGHVDNEMINKIYSHLTKEGKIKRVVDEIERLENEQTQDQTNAKELIKIGKEQKENDIIEVYKDVLYCLLEANEEATKEDYKRLAEAKTIDRLSTLIYCDFYKPFEKWGIDINTLKDTYNKEEKDKVSALKKVIEQAKERIQSEKDLNTI